MDGGILNEPVRECAEKLMDTFGEQLRIGFTHLLFIAIAEDGTFRSANFSKAYPLNADAVRLIAKHLGEWADNMEK